MVGNERRYVYPGELSEGWLRLLQVQSQPTISNDELNFVCHLTTHKVSQCPSYTALSYSWHEPLASQDGNQSDSKSVMLNDQRITVTPNLFHALHHIAARQPRDQTAYYWIDAVCIDQSNDSERTSQVAIMHRIYQKAEGVLVWLGPDPREEVYGVREFSRALLQRFYHEDDRTSFRQYQKNNFIDGDVEHNLASAKLPPLDADIWKAVVAFWDRRWWARAWVHQEVAVAKRVKLFCGETEFTQFEIVETSRLFTMSGLSSSLMHLRTAGPNRLRSIAGRPVGGSAVRIDDLQRWARGEVYRHLDDFCAVTQRLVGRADSDEHGFMADFLLHVYTWLLHNYYRDDATDPRDKIFSLLVLLKHIAAAYNCAEIPLTIDYSRSVEDVFRETTAWIISESGWLGILCLLQPRRKVDTLNGWPSWVPDYNASVPSYPMFFYNPVMQARIKKHIPFITAKTKPTLSGKCLTVSVKRIGVVADAGDTYNSMIDGGYFELTARLLLKFPSMVNGQGKSRIDAWIDTLAGRSSARPVDSDERAKFKQWLCFYILRAMKADFRDGIIRYGKDHLEKMPNFELLANTDDTETLPNYAYWLRTFPGDEKAAEGLAHRPIFDTLSLWGKRLVRIVHLGFPCCPPAQLLAVGPEDTRAGDEIYLVAGTAMPLVLRPCKRENALSPGESQHLRARIVGEASVWGFDDVVERMECEPWQKCQID